MKAIPFPVLETKIIHENAEIDNVLTHLNHYDWISLTSRNAIKAFIKRAGELDIPLEQLKETHYCAIGKDQELLRSFGLDAIVEIETATPQGIFRAIKKMNCAGKKIAVFAPLVIRMPETNMVPNYIDSLTAAGLQVTRIDAYTTSLCYPERKKILFHKLKKGNIDLIAFTSTGEIEALLSIVGGAEKLAKTPIACFGPHTYNNAIKLGLSPTFMAKNFSSFEGYVEAIIDYFKQTSQNSVPPIP